MIGKDFKFAFKNHFKNHHGVARKNQMRDDGYKELLGESSRFEITALSALYICTYLFYFYFLCLT